MILYIDREQIPDLENIRSDVIRYLVRKAEGASVRYRRLGDYYLGHHPILREKKEEDEVRVAVNYAKYVVDIALGYYLGEAVKYSANRQEDTGGQGYPVELPLSQKINIAPLIDCYDRQQISGVDSQIGKGMGIFGDCLELCYASDEWSPQPRSAYIDPCNGVLVCDASVEHRKLFALLWDKREKVTGERYYACDLYTDRTVRHYEGGTKETAPFHQVGVTEYHWFGAVPVIAYENNDERQGDFEQVISLIDAYNGLMSNRLTDKRKFVDALLVFFGMSLRDGDEKRLVQEKFLDGAPLDARAEYIQKTFDEASVQVLADALVREIHKMTMTVDMSDENFSGNSSGQALKLKLLTMNLLCKNKIRKMEKGLKERFQLYNHFLTIKGEMDEVSVTDIDVVFTLSTPINETEIVQTVTQLQGIVDDETLLSQLWFVSDPAEALENLKKQKQESQAAYQKAFGVPSTDEETDAEDETKRVLGFAGSNA